MPDGQNLVIFILGIRLNRPWKIHRWWPIVRLLRPMIRELRDRPQPGFLHAEVFSGWRETISIQYWEDWQTLHAYAHDKDSRHVPAWARFNRLIGFSGDVGIWHETYVIPPGPHHETIYHNVPPLGLGRIAPLHPVRGPSKTFAGRLGARSRHDTGP